MGSARINAVRQRLADYEGMGKFRDEPDYLQHRKTDTSKGMGNVMSNKFMEEGTREKIVDRLVPEDLPCKDEATCGASSEYLLDEWKNLLDDYPDLGEVKPIGGVYTGPGAEHSQAGFDDNGVPSVGHVWLELPDGSIVDPSAGQFINPKHKPLKQRQRFRIIPKESGTYKYYKKDPLLQHRVDRDFGSKNREVARKLRKMGIDPFPSKPGTEERTKRLSRKGKLNAKSARIQMARERLGAVGKVDWSKSMGVKPDLTIPNVGAGFLSPKGEYFHNPRYQSHDGWLTNILKSTGDKSLMKKYDPYSRHGVWLKDSGMIRLRNQGFLSQASGIKNPLYLESNSTPTNAQIRSLKTYIKDYDINPDDILVDDRANSNLETELKLTNRFNAKLRQRIAVTRKRKTELLNPPKDPNVAESSVIDENKIGVETSDMQEQILRRGVGSKRPQSETLDKMSGKFIITKNAEKWAKLRLRIAGLGFRERILNWLKEQPRFKSFDPDSSFVGSVKYDQDNQSMQIELNGKKYDFCNVEERLFDSFSGAGSKGAFFNREIKSLHNCGAW